jgi:prolyl-tRNA editing enzyme YbaK/EbsC (Cys-tRNA(Pro) deacylase)
VILAPAAPPWFEPRMPAPLEPSARIVQQALRDGGFANEVVELADSARTSAEAAAALGCDAAQIAKSLVFRAERSGRAVLVVASGTSRVDEKKLAAVLGEGVGRAHPDFVRAETGFAIGGIPPLGHVRPLTTFVDERLLRLDRIWAAAGHPHAVFALTPAELVEMTGGRVVDVAKAAQP